MANIAYLIWHTYYDDIIVKWNLLRFCLFRNIELHFYGTNKRKRERKSFLKYYVLYIERYVSFLKLPHMRFILNQINVHCLFLCY